MRHRLSLATELNLGYNTRSPPLYQAFFADFFGLFHARSAIHSEADLETTLPARFAIHPPLHREGKKVGILRCIFVLLSREPIPRRHTRSEG